MIFISLLELTSRQLHISLPSPPICLLISLLTRHFDDVPIPVDHLTKFALETLFYLFYSMPRDILQACAAQELYRREWRYHGELRLWLKVRSQQELMQGQPNVQFLYFDVSGWEARLFTSQLRGSIATGLLSEEDVRVKATTHSQGGTAQPGGS